MTRPGAARRQEDALLARPRQAALLTAGVVAVTAVVFALVADHGTLAHIQRLDDAWLRLMVSGRTPPLTAIAKVLNILGLVYVTLPVRIVLAGFLALRRRWWHLAAFTAVAFSIVMGLSRAYLAAHWLSDATAGILLGTSCALVTALIADQLQRRHNKGQRPARPQRPAGVPPPRRAGSSR